MKRNLPLYYKTGDFYYNKNDNKNYSIGEAAALDKLISNKVKNSPAGHIIQHKIISKKNIYHLNFEALSLDPSASFLLLFNKFIITLPVRSNNIFEKNSGNIVIKSMRHYCNIRLRVKSVWMQEVGDTDKYKIHEIENWHKFACLPRIQYEYPIYLDDRPRPAGETITYFFENPLLIAEPIEDNLD